MGISLKAVAKIGWRYAVLYTLKSVGCDVIGIKFSRHALACLGLGLFLKRLAQVRTYRVNLCTFLL